MTHQGYVERVMERDRAFAASLVGKPAMSPGRVVRLMIPQADNIESSDEMWVIGLDSKGKVVGAKHLNIISSGMDWYSPENIVKEALALGGVSLWVCLLQPGGKFQLTYDDHCSPEKIQVEARKQGIEFRNYTRISQTHYINVRDYFPQYFR